MAIDFDGLRECKPGGTCPDCNPRNESDEDEMCAWCGAHPKRERSEFCSNACVRAYQASDEE